MAREKDGYRDNLERVNELIPDKEVLSYKDICSLFGCSLSTAKRKWSDLYNKRIGGVPKTAVARAMCK